MDRLILGLVVVVGVPAATVGYVWIFEWVLGHLPYTTAAKVRPWLWLLPAFVLLLFYLIYPGINTIRISFMNANSTESDAQPDLLWPRARLVLQRPCLSDWPSRGQRGQRCPCCHCA